ncbi:unnamed protein product [Musa hybrid cultivar]
MENLRSVRCSENEEIGLYLWRKRQEMVESNGLSENLDQTLSKAYRSICDAKTPIKTLKDLSQIKGVGKWILRLMQGFFQESVADVPSTTNETHEKGKKAKEPKRYVPKKNSVAYALLITLYRAMTNGSSYMKKQELIDAAEASGLSRTSIASDKSKQPGQFGISSRDWYTGWNCMKSLISKGLVVKSSCPAKYMLTQEGQEAARECLLRSGSIDLEPAKATCRSHSALDGQSASPVDLTLQSASVSCQTEMIDIPTEAVDRYKQADFLDSDHDSANLEKCSYSTAETCMPIVLDSIANIPVGDAKCRNSVYADAAQSSFNLRACTSFDSPMHKPSANDATKGNDNAIAMPPYRSGEKFEDIYDVILILDDRENFGSRSRKIVDNIHTQFNILVEFRRLPVGDGIWIARHRGCNTEYVLDFIVERKRVDDLCRSIRDNRYKDQKLRLQRSGLQKLIYLVEGDQNCLEAAESIKTACFTTEILEGFDVQRTSGFADTVRRYGYLTKSIIQYYTMHFIDKAMCSRVCPSYDEFVKKCQDLEKMTISDVFALQLMQVPQVTEEIALAVVDLYPTLLSLAQAYSHIEGDLRAQEELLKNRSKIISASASRNIFKLIWGHLARFICLPERAKRAMMPLLAGVVVQDDGSSSSVTSSPLETLSLSPPSLSPHSPWVRELKSDERGLCLIHLLLDCANRVASGGSLDPANAALEQIALLAAPDGDAMQRIASHFAEALARRAIRSWPGLCHALDSARVLPLAEAAVARRHFLDLCPFLRLSFVVTNQAIMEAMEGERVVHVVDLNASDPAQWIPLLQALSARSEGPPHLKITGIHEHKEVLHYTAIRLSEAAERLDVPFQFIPLVSRLDNLDIERLRVKTGEALAISSVLQLHSLLATEDKDHLANTHSTSAESAARPPTRIQSFLASLWGLSPKIVVVTEQEANHNGKTLKERLVEALFYYAAVFDSLDLTVPRQSVERLRVEKMLFGEEIRNIIACEGLERKERHEKLERWSQRMGMAGFRLLPLSYYGLLQARRLLQSFGWQGYKVKEENGCFMMCWQDRPLFSVSAWRCNQ